MIYSIIASVAWDAPNKIIVSLFQHSHMRKTIYEHAMTNKLCSKKLLKMQHERAHRDYVKFPGEETDDAIFSASSEVACQCEFMHLPHADSLVLTMTVLLARLRAVKN